MIPSPPLPSTTRPRPLITPRLLAELENNLGISEKTLSEFIIDLAKGKKGVKEFKAALDANDAEFPLSLVETLWGIIQRLQVRRTRLRKRVHWPLESSRS